MMQVSKRVPLEDPQTLMIVRGIYILSNVIIISIYAYTHFIINKKKGKSAMVL
jgi:Phosphate transport (Pho88)